MKAAIDKKRLKIPKLPFTSAAELKSMRNAPFGPWVRKKLLFPFIDTDIVIATYPKSGTTWVQQIAHGLRSSGNMDFTEIMQVSPWLELAPRRPGADLTVAQKYEPRLFKTHLTTLHASHVPKYIHIVRDPKDTLISYYNYWADIIIDPKLISIEDFAETFFFDDAVGDLNDGEYKASYWQHLISWRQWTKTPILYLCFENMKEDLENSVLKIAEFLDIEPTQELIKIATKQSQFDFMRAHKEQFTEYPQWSNKPFEKVVTGNAGEHKTKISQKLSNEFDLKWEKAISPTIGLQSYTELQKLIGHGKIATN